jgi:hypothetical protein
MTKYRKNKKNSKNRLTREEKSGRINELPRRAVAGTRVSRKRVKNFLKKFQKTT